jgi:hypothetical protein
MSLVDRVLQSDEELDTLLRLSTPKEQAQFEEDRRSYIAGRMTKDQFSSSIQALKEAQAARPDPRSSDDPWPSYPQDLSRETYLDLARRFPQEREYLDQILADHNRYGSRGAGWLITGILTGAWGGCGLTGPACPAGAIVGAAVGATLGRNLDDRTFRDRRESIQQRVDHLRESHPEAFGASAGEDPPPSSLEVDHEGLERR